MSDQRLGFRRQIRDFVWILLAATCFTIAACKKPSSPAPSPQAASKPSQAIPPQPLRAPNGQLLTKSSDEIRAREEQAHHAIREVDLEKFLQEHAAEIDSNLVNYKEYCAEGEKPVREVRFEYADLDGDANDEATFQCWSCVAGNGGPNFFGVLKLMGDGKVVSLPIVPFKSPFQGRDPFSGLRGHAALEIENGKLEDAYPVYVGDECEAWLQVGNEDSWIAGMDTVSFQMPS